MNRQALVHHAATASKAFFARDYAGALKEFELARRLAETAADTAGVARITCNIGGCQYALHQYRPALASFRESRRMAVALGDNDLVAAADTNIASLYSEMGDLESALECLRGTISKLNGTRSVRLPHLQIQMASLRARQGRMKEALALFGRGIEEADRLGDGTTSAFGWNRLGEELLRHGYKSEAERALLEAYRFRKLNHLALDISYWNLGRLRLAQGDMASASALLDLAAESARKSGVEPLKDIYADRSRLRMVQGRLREALEDARVAVRLARAWRSEPPDDLTRIGSEVLLDSVYSALVDAGNRLYLETRDPALIRETFEAEEENRASSLRALLRRRRSPPADRPAEYWEALASLQRAEIAALREGKRSALRELSAARVEVARLEAEIEPAHLPSAGLLLDRLRETLDADTAVFTFGLGESISWLWALDREGVELYALPPRTEIEAQVRRAATAIRDDSPDAETAGATLYTTLFGSLSRRFERKRRWLLEREGPLYDVPVSALVVRPGQDRPVYLIDLHTTETIPGAGFRLEAAALRGKSAPAAPIFLGIGDAIYNSADPRLPAAGMGLWTWLPRAASSAGNRSEENKSPVRLVLPRLVASGNELKSCAQAWKGERELLTGTRATERNVADQLRRRPSVVHFAAHVVGTAGSRDSGLIALSLGAGGEPELLSPERIEGWDVSSEVVVLSGCYSSRGATLPGAGLLGLTRAWLTAGARTVVASLWPTPDEDGHLFQHFYRGLADGRLSGSGEALRAAQLQSIRGGGWRARPRYWAAYFVVGSD